MVRKLAVMGGALAWAARAQAACPAPYAVEGLLADLAAAETALKASDGGAAAAAAGRLEAGLPCLPAALPRAIAGRAYRAIGGGLALASDPRGAGWLRTAAELEPSFVYGLEDLPTDHPVRGLYETAKAESGGDPTGAGTFTGTAWLDGRRLTTAEARGNRPHLFQQDTGSGITGVVIEGAAFPAGAVTGAAPPAPEPGGKPPKPPKEPKPGRVDPAGVEPEPRVASGSPTTIKRNRPWEKTPLIVGGAVIAVAGGALYGLSASQAAAAADAPSLTELNQHRKATNQLFVASLAVVGVGAGTLTWGAILDGGTVMPAFGVRF